MHPDIWLALLAGLLYFIQPLVNAIHYPKGQRKTYYTMMVLSPLFIIYASLHSAAAISLYWVVSASFLIVQTHFGHRRYKKQAQAAIYNLKITSPNVIKHLHNTDICKSTQVLHRRRACFLLSRLIIELDSCHLSMIYIVACHLVT